MRSTAPPVLRLTGLLVCLAVVGSARAVAQVGLGSVSGTIRDQQGQPIAGVTFHLKDATRGRELTFETNSRGFFSRRGIPPGDYELVVEKEAYEPIHDTLSFRAGEDKRLEFTLVIAVTPAEAAFEQGVAAFNAGDLTAAAARFEEAARLAPDTPEIYTNLGLVYLRVGRTEEGIGMLERAAELAPDKPQAAFQLAAAYIEASRTDEAIDLIRRGLGEQPDLDDPLMLDAMVTLGSVYFARGDIEASVAAFERALAASPELPGALLGLGKCRSSQGDTDRALEYFSRVVAANPESPEAAEARAFIDALKRTR